MFNLRDWLLPTAVFLFLSLICLVSLIQLGYFDPEQIGTLQYDKTLLQQATVTNTEQVIWLATPPLPENYSVRLTAVLQTGEPDSSYGLLIGSPEAYLAVAVSPVGYLTIWETSQPSMDLIPWQPWPHVALGNEPNEIWLDVIGSQVTVRINREWLWAGEWEPSGGQVGLVSESFGETAVVEFQHLELFWE